MLLADPSWSQQTGLSGWPLALVLIAICLLIAWWLWLCFRSR